MTRVRSVKITPMDFPETLFQMMCFLICMRHIHKNVDLHFELRITDVKCPVLKEHASISNVSWPNKIKMQTSLSLLLRSFKKTTRLLSSIIELFTLQAERVFNAHIQGITTFVIDLKNSRSFFSNSQRVYTFSNTIEQGC